MPRQVSQRIVITNAETLMDSILLLIGEFIEHGCKVGHFIVIRDAFTSVAIRSVTSIIHGATLI